MKLFQQRSDLHFQICTRSALIISNLASLTRQFSIGPDEQNSDFGRSICRKQFFLGAMREIGETNFSRSLCREMALGDKKIKR